MIVFTVLLSLAAVAYAAVARLLGQAERRRPAPMAVRPLPLRPAIPVAESLPVADRPAWTALDDLQLDRLLKDSS